MDKNLLFLIIGISILIIAGLFFEGIFFLHSKSINIKRKGGNKNKYIIF